MEFKPGILKEPFEPFVFPVGFLVSNEKACEFGVGKLSGFGMVEPVLEGCRHAEEFELVQG
jgi:hypothetical protein